ncbi:hypothetical protein TCAL_17098 [Tigriopus californicus]|uniref:Reverse transcriptase domain-containing protein n=1 Tax=Tigriopus californicus TaxID=6832 RepID=A0A553PQY1_TIGCA|nr:hypothetical protein TCAL_17098 [Tigriopus californicus]
MPKLVHCPIHPARSDPDLIKMIKLLATSFAKVDAIHGFFQIPLYADSADLTTFITEEGCFRYNRMLMVVVVGDLLSLSLTYPGMLSSLSLSELGADTEFLALLPSVFKPCGPESVPEGPPPPGPCEEDDEVLAVVLLVVEEVVAAASCSRCWRRRFLLQSS